MNIEPIKLPLPHGCMGIHPKSLKKPCAMGVDVRTGSFDVAIGDMWVPAPDRKVLRLVFAGKVRDEKDVIWLAHQYPVRCGVMDSRPEGTIAKRTIEKLCRAQKEFWRAQYNTNPSAVERTINREERLITIERTMTLDTVFFGFSTGLGAALPQNFADITGGDFKKEMCASTRSPFEWRGQPWWRWSENCADHAFHAWNYMAVAADVCQLHLLISADSDAMMPQRGVQAQPTKQDSDYETGDEFDFDRKKGSGGGGEEEGEEEEDGHSYMTFSEDMAF